MAIINIATPLRRFLSNASRIEVDCKNLSAVFAELIERSGLDKAIFLTEDCVTSPFVCPYINGVSYAGIKVDEVLLKADDIIDLIVAIPGG